MTKTKIENTFVNIQRIFANPVFLPNYSSKNRLQKLINYDIQNGF